VTRAATAALCAVLLAGCLFRTAEAPRFYRPGSAALDDGDGAAPAAASTTAAPLRLASVRSAPFLREKIVWRVSDVEYGLYEQRRWFELPSRYVRRALTATIQDTPGLRLVDDIDAPRLDAEVLAFDEVLSPRHEASVALAIRLRQGTRTALERTYAATVPIEGDGGPAMAQAMGRALDETAAQVAKAVAAALSASGKPAAPPRRTPGSRR
jgi:ABC-type uncharacterized transport system auxiliary subunit